MELNLSGKMIKRDLLKARCEQLHSEGRLTELLFVKHELTQLEMDILNRSYDELKDAFDDYKTKMEAE